MKDDSGELTKGVYATQLSGMIGKGAYDKTDHINEKFLEATTIGPYPRECQEAWDEMREEEIANYNLAHESDRDKWERRLGPHFQATHAHAS
jgi:hypothetical protein